MKTVEAELDAGYGVYTGRDIRTASLLFRPKQHSHTRHSMIDLTAHGPISRPVTGAVLVLAFGFLSLLAASKPKIQSVWAEKPVAIDGVNTEWPVLSTIDKNVRFSIGVRNDDLTLYVVLVTSDRATAVQTLTEGLVVWLDATGGSNKRFGFRYPFGGPGGCVGAGVGAAVGMGVGAGPSCSGSVKLVRTGENRTRAEVRLPTEPPA